MIFYYMKEEKCRTVRYAILEPERCIGGKMLVWHKSRTCIIPKTAYDPSSNVNSDT